MGTSNSLGTYVAGKPSIKTIPSVTIRCEKINVLPINNKVLLKLIVSGISSKDLGGGYSLKLVPSDANIKLSTTDFDIEEGWTIQTIYNPM